MSIGVVPRGTLFDLQINLHGCNWQQYGVIIPQGSAIDPQLVKDILDKTFIEPTAAAKLPVNKLCETAITVQTMYNRIIQSLLDDLMDATIKDKGRNRLIEERKKVATYPTYEILVEEYKKDNQNQELNWYTKALLFFQAIFVTREVSIPKMQQFPDEYDSIHRLEWMTKVTILMKEITTKAIQLIELDASRCIENINDAKRGLSPVDNESKTTLEQLTQLYSVIAKKNLHIQGHEASEYLT